jgi:hypothetical protein
MSETQVVDKVKVKRLSKSNEKSDNTGSYHRKDSHSDTPVLIGL